MIRMFLVIMTLVLSTSIFAKNQQMKVIFDTDAATDDVFALIYLAHQPNVSIEGITVAGTGEAHGKEGAANMADLAYLIGHPTIPIAYGRDSAYNNSGHPFPDYLRKLMDHLFDNKNVPHHPNPNISASAVKLMRQIVAKNNKITILATGPLTNVAEFIETYPHLKNKIEKIVIMGGAVDVEGNIRGPDPTSDNTVAEWNIYAAPKAAEIVFTSNIPVTLVPLDATNQVPMTKKFYESLSKAQNPELKVIYLLLKDIVDTFGLEAFLTRFYLWDALAAIICIDEKRADTETIPIQVVLTTAQTKRVNKDNQPVSIIKVAKYIPYADHVLDRFLEDIRRDLHH